MEEQMIDIFERLKKIATLMNSYMIFGAGVIFGLFPTLFIIIGGVFAAALVMCVIVDDWEKEKKSKEENNEKRNNE